MRSQQSRLALVLALSLGTLLGAGSARAIVVTPYAAAGSEPVVGGVVHEWGTTQTELATQQVNVLRVAAGAPDVHFETGLPFGRVNARQKTSLQAQDAVAAGHHVVGAINADFWRTSPTKVTASAGLNIRSGELVTGNDTGRGALGFDAAGTPMIGQPHLVLTMTLPASTSIVLAGVNQLRDPDGLVLYTPRFGPSTGTDASGVEVVLSGVPLPLSVTSSFTATVDQVLPGAGDTPIGAGKMILSGVGAGALPLAALSEGAQVGLSVSIDSAWQSVVTAVGGGAQLVHEGQPIDTYDQPNELTPNPRTAAGITADGSVVLVTVDGRSESSGGMPLADLAQVMVTLGAVEALNLDGGGSSTMVVDPAGAAPLALANAPSAGYERRVNTSLQVVSTSSPTVSTPLARLKPGVSAGRSDAAITLSWVAADADGSIRRTQLQGLASDGTWRDIALAKATTTSVSRRLVFGRSYQFRVRVTDDAGNASAWSTSPIYRLLSFSERDAALSRTGKWPVNYRDSAIGRHLARNSIRSGAASSVALTFTGMQVAWVAPTSGLGGTAEVRLDGSTVATVDLHTARAFARMVVFVGPGVDQAAGVQVAQRRIEIVNVSGRSRPYVDLDAFLVLTAQ